MIEKTFRLNEKAGNNPEKETTLHGNGVSCHLIWFGVGRGKELAKCYKTLEFKQTLI